MNVCLYVRIYAHVPGANPPAYSLVNTSNCIIRRHLYAQR